MGPALRSSPHIPCPAAAETDRLLAVPVAEVDVCATLAVLSGSEAGRVMALPERAFLLGRGPNADMRFDDHGVSRSHARITFEDGGYSVCAA